MSHLSCEGCILHCHVEGSQSENSKVLTRERHLLSDDSINAIRLTKYVIRVTGSGHAYKMAITPSLIQARRSYYAVYAKCMELEKARKYKDIQQKAKTANEDQDAQNIILRSTTGIHIGPVIIYFIC